MHVYIYGYISYNLINLTKLKHIPWKHLFFGWCKKGRKDNYFTIQAKKANWYIGENIHTDLRCHISKSTSNKQKYIWRIYIRRQYSNDDKIWENALKKLWTAWAPFKDRTHWQIHLRFWKRLMYLIETYENVMNKFYNCTYLALSLALNLYKLCLDQNDLPLPSRQKFCTKSNLLYKNITAFRISIIYLTMSNTKKNYKTWQKPWNRKGVVKPGKTQISRLLKELKLM